MCVFCTETRLINGTTLRLECRGEQKRGKKTCKNLVKTSFHILKFLFLSFARKHLTFQQLTIYYDWSMCKHLWLFRCNHCTAQLLKQ